MLIQQLESLGMATKEQKGGSVVFTPVASGLEATIDPGIVVQSILDPRKTRKLEELTVPVRLDDLAGNGCCKALISKVTGVWPCDRQGQCRYHPDKWLLENEGMVLDVVHPYGLMSATEGLEFLHQIGHEAMRMWCNNRGMELAASWPLRPCER